MKARYTLLAILTFLVVHKGALAQQGDAARFHTMENGQLKSQSFTAVQDSLYFTSGKPAALFDGGISAVIIATVIPILIKNVPKLFYRPENFIKEYGTYLKYPESPLRLDDVNQGTDFDMVYVRRGLGDGTGDKGWSTIAQLGFQFKKLTDERLPGYYSVAFSDYELAMTGVKLKADAAKINVVVQISFNYFDQEHKAQVFHLQPINIRGVTPQAKRIELNGETILKSLQIVPPMHVIESVEIGITDVNTRKKDWDKWLELYDTHKDKLTNYLLEITAN